MDLTKKLPNQARGEAGRPQVEINPTQFERMCQIQCTCDEISHVLGVCRKTLYNWCVREYGMNFESIYEIKSAGGKVSLRRKMFEMAINDNNPTMLIWLSKQHLGMRDKNEVSLDVKTLSDEQLEALTQR